MADEADSEFIEGFNAGGKSLDRITSGAILTDLHKKTNAAKNNIENTLSHETDALQKLQNNLNHVNDEFIAKTQELEGMKRKQQVTLDNNREAALRDVMRSGLDDYLERRPTSLEETRSVHVYFLTSEEVGSELHVGREGGGSRDATFIVTLSQTVQSLATQAAKYWGLNPEKVFFLDRDGRIVQGKMHLSDIILPPESDLMGTGGPTAEGSAAIVPSSGGGQSSALAVPSSTLAKKEAAEDHVVSYTVKGRDYSLTLVRAKTVLTKEDLSQPKGEKWDDFTFDQARLNKDLEETRRKRGDPDPQDMKVSMDTIPSLYDLIKQGNLRKFQKNADKWCRIAELGLFLIMWFLFTLLLKPNHTWTYSMINVGHAIKRDTMTFTLAEQDAYGVHNFSQIVERRQFTGWMEGPLRRALLPGGLDSRNAYPLKVQGRIYHSPTEEHGLDLNWCSDGSSNDTDNGTSANTTNATLLDADGEVCYPASLKQCPNKGVVKLMAYAIKNSQQVPACKQKYDLDPVVTAWRSLYAVDAFSFVTGELSSYLGGQVQDVNLTVADYSTSLAEILPLDDSVAQAPAKLINVLTYIPVQNGIYLSQFLTEFSPGGPLITTYRDNVIALDAGESWEVIVFGVCIALSIIILLLELRRITGWPQRFFYEGKKEPCGLCTFGFIFVPLLLCLGFYIMMKKNSKDFDVMKLSDHSTVVEEDHLLENIFPAWLAKPEPYEWTVSESMLFDLQMMIWFEKAGMVVNLFNFTLMMALSFRYFLVYFPEMHHITMMIHRMTKPVLVTLFLLSLALLGFAQAFYMIFSDQQYEFRNWLVTFLAVLQFAHGGFLNWKDVYSDYAYTWIFLMIVAFIVFTLNLNNILIAVLVSHKKEAELHKNYSSHNFWQQLHRQHMQNNETKELNPALAGFDFGDPVYKDGPKEVKEKPGIDDLTKKVI